MTAEDLATLRRKASLIARELEGFLGIPAPPKRLANPLDTLIATLLSQNTNDTNSHQAWTLLKREFPTWESLLRAPLSAVARAIEIGGLKNQKARRIKNILRLIHRRTGRFDLGFLKKMGDDDVMAYLTSLKGVGKKTASCVMVFSLGRDLFPVDTHIHRLANRLGLVRSKNADQTFDAMAALVPRGKAYSFHVNLIRFGRKVCKAQSPLCGECQLYDLCSFPERERYAAQCRARSASRHPAPMRREDFILLEHVA